jgi:hypothetical protein
MDVILSDPAQSVREPKDLQLSLRQLRTSAEAAAKDGLLYRSVNSSLATGCSADGVLKILNSA